MKFKKIAIGVLAAMLVFSMAGCGYAEPEALVETSGTVATGSSGEEGSETTDPTVDDTTVPTTEDETEPAEATETSGAAEPEKDADTVPTKPASTDPPESKPESTEPPATEPPTTDPPATEPPHSHSYSVANTVAPGCESQGYTVYTCSCGDSYSDNYTAAVGHSYSSTVVDPTTSNQGYTQHTCDRCGDCYQDSFVDPLPAVTLDLAAAEAYGNQYAASTYGWIIDTSLNQDNAGFYPGYSTNYDAIVQYGGQSDLNTSVKNQVDATYEALSAYGSTEGCAVNCDVIDKGDGTYWIYVYYG